jgi:protein TonB
MRLARAASLAASSALFALAILAAVSARYRLALDEDQPSVMVVSELRAPPAPAPPSPQPVERLPLAPLANAETAPPPLAAPPSGEGREPALIVDPHWVRRPAHPERFYPRDAFVRGVDGRVELACFVETDGRLSCQVASEIPAGEGFGDAALALAGEHVMQPALENGAPVRARYRMVVPFSSR